MENILWLSEDEVEERSSTVPCSVGVYFKEIMPHGEEADRRQPFCRSEGRVILEKSHGTLAATEHAAVHSPSLGQAIYAKAAIQKPRLSPVTQ